MVSEQYIKEILADFEKKNTYRPFNVKAALIDMDGTLYDSMPWHARAWHRMMSELGVESSVNEFFSYEGMTGKATINLLFERAFGRGVTDEEAAELYSRKSRYFQSNNHADIMPGAQKMVKTFREFGITPYLVTGSGQASLLTRLTDDFDGEFDEDHRITSKDVKKGKPNPEPYLKGLELAHVSPNRAIVVENAPLGVEAGVKAGIFTLAVNTGPIPKSELEKAGANMTFDSMMQCAETLPVLLSIINDTDVPIS